ncbi:hypothetical protein Taro_052529, partial [Colocasia esculenta]|nr:hypothetical protein [Colocasia esculenta]
MPSVVTSPVGYPDTVCSGFVPVWCWFVSTVLDLVEVEWQLDLSFVATRLRGGLVLFVRVKKGRRVLVPLLVRDRIAAGSGLRHQQ